MWRIKVTALQRLFILWVIILMMIQSVLRSFVFSLNLNQWIW